VQQPVALKHHLRFQSWIALNIPEIAPSHEEHPLEFSREDQLQYAYMPQAPQHLSGRAGTARPFHAIEDVRVDHRRSDVTVAQELLDRPDVVLDANSEAGFVRAEIMRNGTFPWSKNYDMIFVSATEGSQETNV
jgi:hypothetical protein